MNYCEVLYETVSVAVPCAEGVGLIGDAPAIPNEPSYVSMCMYCDILIVLMGYLLLLVV